MKKCRNLGIALIAVLAVLVSCGTPETTGMDGNSTGRIVIDVNGLCKVMGPPQDYLDVAVFEVTGTGPTPFNLSITGSTEVENLLPGSYNLGVIAKNGTDIQVGSGTEEGIIVEAGKTAIATVIIEETDGEGSFDLSLGWEPSIIDSPVITGFLKDGAGVQTDMVFTDIDPVLATAGSLTESLQNGFFMNVVQIHDAGVLSCGYADIVRIVANYTTEGSVFLHAVEGHGFMEINFDLNFFEPLHFTGTPAEGGATVYGDYDLDLAVQEADEIPFAGAWYRNGEAIGTGSSYTVEGGNLIEGEAYRYDFIGWDMAGERAGAAHWIVVKEPIETTMCYLTWTGTAGPTYRVTAFNAGDGSIYLQDASIVGVDGENSYVLEIPDNGNYKIQIMNQLNGHSEYWQEQGSIAGATVITIPLTEPGFFDFDTIDY